MGNLSSDWIEELKIMAGGDSTTSINVMYPTEETVKTSYLGADGGGTIHFQRKFWYSETFPRQILRNCKLLSNGLLHAKVFEFE